ncbi:MAG: CarD family transcriptional regulator [Clostridiales bacterium]|nr:CarD family transcriptional regulator [Clostridiales bacterium]
MYNVGEVFVYGSNGTCKIVDIKREKFSDSENLYYVLRPYADEREIIYVPVKNEKLISKMKTLLGEKELLGLIKSIPQCNDIWIDNTALRREKYKEIINKADRVELFALLKTLYNRKLMLATSGKNLSVYDERFLRQAQKIIHSEISFVMKIPRDEVEPFITNLINAA